MHNPVLSKKIITYILNSPQHWHHLTYMHHVHLMTGEQRGGGQCERGGEQQRLKQRRRRGGGSAMHKESDGPTYKPISDMGTC